VARSTPRTSTSSSNTGNGGGSGNGNGKDARLVQAITNYYALLPGDTDTAWARLTPSYQQNPGGGRQNYDAFWNSMASVSATHVTSDGQSTVTATITYQSKAGRTYVERTSYGLVEDGGTYKINSSSVISG
jgi:hypothetical protein